MDTDSHSEVRRNSEKRRKLREDLSQSYAPEKVDCPIALKDASEHNDLPSTLAVQLAQGIRARSENALLDLESRLLQIEDQIIALQQEKEKIVQEISPMWSKIRLCKTVLSVFRRVPTEILQEIAVYAQPSQPSLHPNHAPMLLAHVCRTWRQAVFEFPVLWRELYFEMDMKVNYWTIGDYTDAVQNWFKRTGSHSLSLHIYTPSGSRDIEKSRLLFIQYFLGPLRATLLRIQHFSIGAPWVADFLPLFAGKLPAHIKSLTIKNSYQGMQNLHVLFGCSPMFKRIDRLILDKPLIHSGFLEHAIPWSQITTLALCQVVTIDQYVDMLDACPQLITASFKLNDSSHAADPPSSSTTHIHENLRKLSIYCIMAFLPLPTLYLTYRFERLETLELGHNAEAVEDSLGELPALAKFFHPINKLSLIGDWSESFEVLSNILQSCTNLTDFHFVSHTSPFPIIELLLRSFMSVNPSISGAFLPEISTITLENSFSTQTLRIVQQLLGLLMGIAGVTKHFKLLRISNCPQATELRTMLQTASESWVKLGSLFEVTSSDALPDWCQMDVGMKLALWQEGVEQRLGKR